MLVWLLNELSSLCKLSHQRIAESGNPRLHVPGVTSLAVRAICAHCEVVPTVAISQVENNGRFLTGIDRSACHLRLVGIVLDCNADGLHGFAAQLHLHVSSKLRSLTLEGG